MRKKGKKKRKERQIENEKERARERGKTKYEMRIRGGKCSEEEGERCKERNGVFCAIPHPFHSYTALIFSLFVLRPYFSCTVGLLRVIM